MLTFLRNLTKLRSREESFIITLDALRRSLKSFAEKLRKERSDDRSFAALQKHLGRVDDHIHYQYTSNVSVHTRLLGELLRHLFQTARELRQGSPASLRRDAAALALQCLEVARQGLLEYRGHEARWAAARAKRLRKQLTKIRKNGASFEALGPIVDDPEAYVPEEHPRFRL